MPIILAGSSCDDCECLFHRRKPYVDWRNAERVRDSATLLCSAQPPTISSLRDCIESSWILRELPKPLHVLVADRDSCRVNRLAHASALGSPIPPDSLIRLSDDVYACSPEFRYLRFAAAKCLPAVAQRGMELCAIYLIDPESEDGFVGCVPRTSPELIGRYLEGCAGAYGAKRARRALRYLRANARSPMEGVLAVIIVLEPRWGGYGIADLELNAPVETNLDFPLRGSSRIRKTDIYFSDAMLDIEYKGRLRHSGASAMSADDHRRIELENAGITVITLSYEDASNVSTMNRTIERVRKLRGLRAETPSWETLEKRNQLFASLMPGSVTACNPALELERWKSCRKAAGRSLVGVG